MNVCNRGEHYETPCIYGFWWFVTASSCDFQVLVHLHIYTFIVVSTLVVTVGIELETL